MATFDNPSYFTMSGSSPTDHQRAPAKNGNSRRLKNWLKSKRPFRSPKTAVDENRNPTMDTAPPPNPSMPCLLPNSNDLVLKNEVVYYNFTTGSAPDHDGGVGVDEDDVFSDTSTIRDGGVHVTGSTRTLNRRRHSLGSWFRSSLAAVRKTATSTASGLESEKGGASGVLERPSTSSENQLLTRTTSASTGCVSYRSSRDVRTNDIASSSSGGRRSRSRLPVAVKSQGEVRARARFARQERLVFGGDVPGSTGVVDVGSGTTPSRLKSSVSASRIPRPVTKTHTTASLDRRYTNSTEVLASSSSKPDEMASSISVTAQAMASPMMVGTSSSTTGLQTEDQQQSEEAGDAFKVAAGDCGRAARMRLRTNFNGRGRSSEDRAGSSHTGSRSCCSRIAMTSRSDRRRTSLDVTSASMSLSAARRRCQRCREKAETIALERHDVVFIYSRNCSVAFSWITYLSDVLKRIYESSDRPVSSITSQDVESIISCNPMEGPGKSRRSGAAAYENQPAVERLDAERSARRHADRKTTAAASLQVVLVSRPLLQHVRANANDPLGQLLDANRVVGLLLAVDSQQDVTELHRSALYTFDLWPKVVMGDQDMHSVNEFLGLSAVILRRRKPSLPLSATFPTSTGTSTSVSTIEPTPASITASVIPARFKLTPKKIRPGENKVTLLLLETVDDIRHQTEIVVASTGNQGCGDAVKITSKTWINPYCISFVVPDKFLERDVTAVVRLTVGGSSWGTRQLKCPHRLGELSLLLHKNTLVSNPLDLMCQALKISPFDRDRLDAELSKTLTHKNVWGHVFRVHGCDGSTSTEEFPTLLHFASRFGLARLARELLQCPGWNSALAIRNVQGRNALQMAEVYQHGDVVEAINTARSSDRLSEDDPTVYLPMKNEPEVVIPETSSVPSPQDQSSDDHSVYVTMEKEGDAGVAMALIDGYDFVPAPRIVPPAVQKNETDSVDQIYLSLLAHDVEAVTNPSEEVLDTEIPNGGNQAVGWSRDVQESPRVTSKVPVSKKRSDGTKVGFHRPKRNSIFSPMTPRPPKGEYTESAVVCAELAYSSRSSLDLLHSGNPSNPTNSEDSPFSAPDWHEPSPPAGLPLDDRSSVASRSSHDSGAHSDSTEEKKALANRSKDHDYDFPPAAESLKMATYLTPPPPRPISGQAYASAVQIRKQSPECRLSATPPPQPPPRLPLPLECLQETLCNLGAGFAPLKMTSHGKEIPSGEEEPDVMVSFPILMPPSQKNSNIKEQNHSALNPALDSAYMEMTSPLAESSNDPKTLRNNDDDYICHTELHMPENAVIRRRKGSESNEDDGDPASAAPPVPPPRPLAEIVTRDVLAHGELRSKDKKGVDEEALTSHRERYLPCGRSAPPTPPKTRRWQQNDAASTSDLIRASSWPSPRSHKLATKISPPSLPLHREMH